MTDREVLRTAMGDGVAWSLGLTALGLLGVLVTTGLPFRGPARTVALLGAGLAPAALAVTGHTRTMSPLVVGYLADVVHVAAAALWFGGLGALLVVLRRRRGLDDLDGAAEATARFSGWAAVLLAAVAVTGGTMAWIEVGGLHPLTSTTYGRLLLAKVGVVGLVVVAAAWNRFRLLPLLGVHGSAVEGIGPPAEVEAEGDPAVDGSGDGDGAPAGGDRAALDRRWQRFAGVVRLEAVGLVVVIALTAVLVNVTPARDADTGPVSTSAVLGSGTVEVIVDPARTGRNDIHAYVLDARGRPDDRYTTARFELSMGKAGVGPLERTPVNAGGGHFQLVGTDLSIAGEWELKITVQPDRFTEQSALVTFTVR